MRLGWFLYHVASGQAFFSGITLIVVAVGIVASGAKWRRAATVLFLFGALLVIVSATPLPWFMYALMTVSLGGWLFAESRRDRWSKSRMMAARGVVLALLTTAVAMELPYHVVPRPDFEPSAALAVIGDSISAGMGENEAVTWPTLLARQHQIVVRDHSAMGATVSSAQKQAAMLLPEDRLVVLEIGGNDLLGDTTAANYASGLDALLGGIRQPGRTIVMLELPLPPTRNQFGLVQRRLASKHGVVLVPKRILMCVLARSDATLDSIHLSRSGHQQLAAAIWQIISPAFRESQPGN